MSIRPTSEPVGSTETTASAVELIIDARRRRIGGFEVTRLLPFALRRLVGPFIYFDQMGPVELPPEGALDVVPHPHIGLATVTYLFEGELVHRDSLGSCQTIRPGDINWMTAGRGVVHSERTGDVLRKSGSRLHGLQLWVALPAEHEEVEPDFHHHAKDTLPLVDVGGASVRLLVGRAWGATSPVRTRSAMFYADATLPSGTELPLPSEHEERAVYVVDGELDCESERATAGRMLVFRPGVDVRVRAKEETRLVALGGAPVGPRHIFWNFVSSSRERIERAKRDWKEGRFPKVPGDEKDFVPLPE